MMCDAEYDADSDYATVAAADNEEADAEAIVWKSDCCLYSCKG